RMVSQKGDAPVLFGKVRKPEGAEGNRHLDLIAEIREATIRVIDEVEAHVFVASGRHEEVALNAQRVYEDLVGLRGVAISIEDDAHPVILENLIPVAERCPNGGGVIVGPKCDVQVLLVVGDERLRFDEGPDLVSGLNLGEA